MAKIDATKKTTLDTNLAGSVVASSSAMKNVIDDYANVINSNSPEGRYAADAGSTDAYAITLDPAPTTYATGMIYRFKANTANTGAATLNVNSLGAKTIKKNATDDMETGDILSDQFVEVMYDGTNMQVISVTSELKTHKADTTPHATIQGIENLGFKAASTLTISSGEITVTQSFHLIDTESSAATDDLVTINGGAQGDVLVLRSVISTRDITIKASGGNIFTFDNTDITMPNGGACVVQLINVDGTNWVVIGTQGVKRSGDTMTGGLTFSNNTAISLKETGGTSRILALMDSSNNINIGSANNPLILGFMTAISLYNGLISTSLIAAAGSPEGVATGRPGSIYLNTNGGASTSLYVKESGTGNTGWVAK